MLREDMPIGTLESAVLSYAAMLALAKAIEEQAAGAAGKASKQAYVEAMVMCEQWMALTPLRTAFRTID